MRFAVLFLALTASGLAVASACGGDSGGDDGGDSAASASRSGEVKDPPPPGQAVASLDGKQFTLDQPGAIRCSVGDDEFAFSFRKGDNETTLGAGGVKSGDLWSGEIRLTVANPQGESGPIDYFVSLPEIDESSLAFEGKSMSYSGPVMKQPPQGAAVSAGEGTISVTCA